MVAITRGHAAFGECCHSHQVVFHPMKLCNAPGWGYVYNDRGVVTGASRFSVAGPVNNQSRGYAYDGIGNRASAVQGQGAGARTTAYTANAVNQYTGINPPRVVEVTGQAVVGAEVGVRIDSVTGGEDFTEVNRALPGNQTGDPNSFRYEVAVPGTEARWVKAEVKVTLNTESQTKTAWLYAPPAEEEPVHDLDGNLIEDGRWKYEWDAENRLVAVEEKARPVVAGGNDPGPPPARQRLTFAYDYKHRRISKTVHAWNETTNSFSSMVKDLRFVYDGWNMVAELDHTFASSTGLAGSVVVRSYVWGPDIAGQRSPGRRQPGYQDAGGVGGLLGVNYQGTTYYPLTDANGNVVGLHAGNGPQDGQLVARYDYDPFGNRITNTGPDVELCPFGFSTKYRDEETGMLDYINRLYDPAAGRWMNEDPIEEDGGINLYGMVGNDAVNHWDYLGLRSHTLLLTTAVRPPDLESGEKSSHRITFNEYGKITVHWEHMGITPYAPPIVSGSSSGGPVVGGGIIMPAFITGTHPLMTVHFVASVYAKPLLKVQSAVNALSLGASGMLVGPLIIDYYIMVHFDFCARTARIEGVHDGYPSYTLRYGGLDVVYDHHQSPSLLDLEPPMEVSVYKEFNIR
jgi:RHS repeat-associated protein